MFMALWRRCSGNKEMVLEALVHAGSIQAPKVSLSPLIEKSFDALTDSGTETLWPPFGLVCMKHHNSCFSVFKIPSVKMH